MKAALLIGINYPGTMNELRGCVNDVTMMRDTITSKYGYKAEDIKLVTDGEATRDRIINELSALAQRAKRGEVKEIWVHYSGHGTYEADKSGDEADGRDEMLVPADYATHGMISDDTIYEKFTSQIPAGVNAMCIFDCCYSGTIMDLPARYLPGEKGRTVSRSHREVRGNIYCLSGCRDSQTSAEAMTTKSMRMEGSSREGSSVVYGGALTLSLLYVLEEGSYRVPYNKTLTKVASVLRGGGFRQVPQLTTSGSVDRRLYFGSFKA